MRALASLCGAKVALDEEIISLKEKIGIHDHYLFILLDGFGNNLLEKTDSTFFKKKKAQILKSVFPSTTASALTSITTLHYPTYHGAIGWWTYLAEFEKSSVYLPFIDRETGKKLQEFAISPEEVFYDPCFLSTLTTRVKSYLPKTYFDSPYSRYSRGNTLAEGYEKIEETFSMIEDFAFKEVGPSYQYLYFPLIDSLEHEFGTDSIQVRECVEKTLKLIEEFSKKNLGKIRFVITADHGLIDIPEDNNFVIDDDHPLLPLLKVPPACETRVPMFFLKDQFQSEQFANIFNEYFDEQFTLISKDEAKSRELFGSDPWHPVSEKRIGDFLALPKGPWTLQYRGKNYSPVILKAVHGAFSPEETEVPLLLI